MPTLRESIETASLPTVKAISGLPRFVPFLVVLALMIGGIVIKGWGWILIGIVMVFLAWMLYLGWPRLTSSEKLMRSAILSLSAGVTLTRAFPQG